MIDIEIQGIDQAQRELSEIAQRLARSTQGAVRRLTDLARDAIAAAAPRGPGSGPHLADSFIALYRQSGQDLVGTVQSAGPAASRLALIIGGTAPHMIQPRTGRALAFAWPGGAGGGAGGIFFFRRVYHPGTAPNDFISRAMVSIRMAADAEAARITI